MRRPQDQRRAVRLYYKLLEKGWEPDLAGRVASDYQWALERRADGKGGLVLQAKLNGQVMDGRTTE